MSYQKKRVSLNCEKKHKIGTSYLIFAGIFLIFTIIIGIIYPIFGFSGFIVLGIGFMILLILGLIFILSKCDK